MGTDHTKAHDHRPEPETERSERAVTFSSGPNQEIKLDVRDEPEAKTLEHKSSFVSVATFKKVSHKVKIFAALNRRPPARFDRSKSVVNALKGLTFISKNEGWEDMEKRFNKLEDKTNGTIHRSHFCECIGFLVYVPVVQKDRSDENRFNELEDKTNGSIHRSQFCECIGMKEDSKEFAEKLFETFAVKQNIHGDSITKDQLKIFWEQINDQDNRLQTFFDMIDKDSDGKINEAEVTEIIKLTASTNKLVNVQKRAKEYAALIMRELDQGNLGYIKIETLKRVLLQTPSPSSSSKSLSRVLSESKGEGKSKPLVRVLLERCNYFVVDNWRRIWVMALWIATMCVLFGYKYGQYRKSEAYKVMGECVCTAKGAAETLKLNMALILLPVCRNTITWLRNNTKLASIVPFDDNLNFHQMIAIGIAIGTIIHTLAHMGCDFPRLIHASRDKYRPMEPFFGHHQQKSYFHFVWSVEGVTGIVMIVLMAIAFTLAAPCFRTGKPKKEYKLRNKLTGFNAFWYSHHLFVIVYALLIVHGIYLYLIHDWYRKTTWMYLAVPVTLYGCERLIRALRSSIEDVTIKNASIYPGDVVVLKMSKPEGFTYRSGQYMFVKCKAVSPFEWHPFSITSCPSDDCLSVHIRVLGDWTKQLKTIFSQAHPPQPGTDCSQGENNPNTYPQVWIDGPYGAPAQEYKQFDVLLLVGLGIGATPMISIVKDIVNNMKAMEAKKHQPEGFNKRKVYFYWSTREEGSFEWFKNVMNEVAELDHNDMIEMHNYCTSVYEEGDARSALIAVLQAINHDRHGLDIVSGTRVKSHFGRPNWPDVYDRIAKNHPGAEVGVFYCGAAMLVKELKHLAREFSHTTTTKFKFHKENF